MTSGIYRIVNKMSGVTYIGSSIDVRTRLYEHKRQLEQSNHRNSYLQRAWRKYGSESFIFEPLVSCDCSMLVRREQAFLDAYIDHGMPIYNLRTSAESKVGMGYTISDESRAKISAAKKGSTPSAEARKKMSAVRIGWVFSPATKEKLRRALIGKKHSPERIAAIRDGRRAAGIKPVSLETRAKLRAAYYRNYPESREKIRKALNTRWKDQRDDN